MYGRAKITHNYTATLLSRIGWRTSEANAFCVGEGGKATAQEKKEHTQLKIEQGN